MADGVGKKRKKTIELFPGMTGFFVPEVTRTIASDARNKEAQLFVQVDEDGNEVGSFFFFPDQGFTDVTKGENLDAFVNDPGTFDPRNLTGFDPEIFEITQKFKGDPQGLKSFLLANPQISVFKQETTVRDDAPTMEDIRRNRVPELLTPLEDILRPR